MPVTATQGIGSSSFGGAPPVACGGLSIPAAALTSAEAVAVFGSMAIADTQTDGARDKIDMARQKREKAIEAARKAIEEAKRAHEDGGFWDELGGLAKQVGTYAAIAAAVGAAAASGGSSLVIAAALIGIGASLAGDQMKRNGMDTTLCTIDGLEIKASDLVVIGGAVAATAMGVSATPGGPQNKLLIDLGRHTVTGASAVRAGASGTQAVAAERSGHFDARAEELAADQRSHENKAARQQQALLGAIDLIRSSREGREQALSVVGSILETRRSIDMAIVGRRA